MKALKIFIGVIIALVVVAVILSFIGPKSYDVSRSVEINAPKGIVWENVGSLEAMDAWSPWNAYDTTMTKSFEGNKGEVGSITKWSSTNENVGEGSQEIIAVADGRIDTKLRFVKPYESESDAYVVVEETENGSKVTWGFKGENGFMSRIFMLFMDMDAAIGPDFEKGLAMLKTMSEEAAANAKPTYDIIEMEYAGKIFIGKKDTVKFAEMAEFFGTNFGAIATTLGQNNREMAGAPSGIYYMWDEANMKAFMAAAIPVSEDKELEGFEKINVAPSKALHIAYYGAYEGSAEAHYAMDAYMKEKGLELNELVIEEYVTDPGMEPDTAKWLTNIYYLIK